MELSFPMQQLLLKAAAKQAAGRWLRPRPHWQPATIHALVRHGLIAQTAESLTELTPAGAALADALLYTEQALSHYPGTYEELLSESQGPRFHHWRPFCQIATVARAFDCTQRAAWRGSLWPGGHCLVGSLLLAPVLRLSFEQPFSLIIGQAGDNKMHAWIETPAGDIIDPTYGQFDHGPALRVLPVERASELGHMGELTLTAEREEQLRQAIRPSSSSQTGWAPEAAIGLLFNDHPST